MKAGSFPVLAPGGGHFPPQMLPVLEHQVPLIMFGPSLLTLITLMMLIVHRWRFEVEAQTRVSVATGQQSGNTMYPSSTLEIEVRKYQNRKMD